MRVTLNNSILQACFYFPHRMPRPRPRPCRRSAMIGGRAAPIMSMLTFVLRGYSRSWVTLYCIDTLSIESIWCHVVRGIHTMRQPRKKYSACGLSLIVGFFILCFYTFRGFWRWYRVQSRPVQIIVAGISAVMLVVSAISNALGTSNQSEVVPTPTPTQAIASVATSAPTQDQPTPIPTEKPTPTPTPKPAIVPTHAPVSTTPPKPTQPACQAVNNNPWCYNFSPGKLIYYPPSGFCSYFNCIPSFYGSDDPGDASIVFALEWFRLL